MYVESVHVSPERVIARMFTLARVLAILTRTRASACSAEPRTTRPNATVCRHARARMASPARACAQGMNVRERAIYERVQRARARARRVCP